MGSQDAGVEDRANAGWRFKCGVGLFILIIVMGLMIPIVAVSGMPAARIAAITGVIFVSNKILLVLTIAVMGKAGFQQLKKTVFGYLPSLKSDGPVGPGRHALGLIMFFLPIISAMLEPYIDSIWPGLRPNLWQLQLLGDLMLIAGIFVLGGNFWDKIRALFVRTARVANTGGEIRAYKALISSSLASGANGTRFQTARK